MTRISRIAGVLLAGGGARRMGGGDKCLHSLGGRPLLTHIIESIAPQVEELILNANGDPDRFEPFGLTVVSDSFPCLAGPLAGILAGMEWLQAHRPGVDLLVSVPADGPFVPSDLVSRLLAAKGPARIACARSGGRSHPPTALWDVTLAEDLRCAMEDEEMRKIDRWTARYPILHADWSNKPFDPFFNVNRPEDLIRAETLLAL